MFSKFASGLSGHGQLLAAHVDMVAVQKAAQRMLATVEGKVATKALAAVGKFGRDKVKSEIPTRYKSVRKAVAWRHMKRKYNAGGRAVKVGAGVGPNILRKKRLTAKQQVRADKLREKIATTQKARKDSKRPGVGMDKANIHWWFAGTQNRMTGTKRGRIGGKRGKGGWKGIPIRVDTGGKKANRGRMPPQARPIMVTLSGYSGNIREIIRVYVSEGITIEGNRNK
jgi:hypothetical protein